REEQGYRSTPQLGCRNLEGSGNLRSAHLMQHEGEAGSQDHHEARQVERLNGSGDSGTENIGHWNLQTGQEGFHFRNYAGQNQQHTHQQVRRPSADLANGNGAVNSVFRIQLAAPSLVPTRTRTEVKDILWHQEATAGGEHYQCQADQSTK